MGHDDDGSGDQSAGGVVTGAGRDGVGIGLRRRARDTADGGGGGSCLQWQKIKGSFKGKGGYSRFRREYNVMVGGMLQGLCEGTVEEDPTEGTWWESAVEKVKSQGAVPQFHSSSFRRQTRVPSSVGLRVGLDVGAGTQSARPLVEQCGFLYIPIDNHQEVDVLSPSGGMGGECGTRFVEGDRRARGYVEPHQTGSAGALGDSTNRHHYLNSSEKKGLKFKQWMT